MMRVTPCCDRSRRETNAIRRRELRSLVIQRKLEAEDGVASEDELVDLYQQKMKVVRELHRLLDAPHHCVEPEGTMKAKTSLYVKLFKAETGRTGIETNAMEEKPFVDELARAILATTPTQADVVGYLTSGFEVVAKIRAYKSEVEEERVLRHGRAWFKDALVYETPDEQPDKVVPIKAAGQE